MKKYITKQSSIKGAGKGLFTKDFFKKGEVIGLAHVNDQPASEIGRNHNHNEKNPTAYSKKIDNKRFIYASKNLKPGEEITTNYRLQPELEQPEDFMREGGALLTKKVTCKSCGWKWNAENGGKDITTCHKCGGQGLIHAQDGGHVVMMSGCPEGMVWSKKDKKCVNLPFNSNTLTSIKNRMDIKPFTPLTTLDKSLDIKPFDPYSDFGKEKPKKIPAIEDSFLETLEKDINDFLENPLKKAAQVSESLKEKGEDPSDALRHSIAGALTAQTIANKTGNIPFISNPLGYLGANIAGIGHELSTLSQAYLDDRPWSVKLQESLEDMYNNSVGANSIFSNKSEKDKINYLLKLTRENKLPDGYGEERPFRDNPKWTDPYNQKQYGGINKFDDGGTIYNVKGSKGNYKKINGKWHVDWNRSGKYQPLSKGDVKARTAVLDKMAKPLYDKDYDEMVAYKNLSTNDKIKKFEPKKEATKEELKKVSERLGRDYKPEDTKLQSVQMVYPEKYIIGPGGGLLNQGLKTGVGAIEKLAATKIPGLFGTTVGQAAGAGFAADALVNQFPGAISDIGKGEYEDAAEKALYGTLGLVGLGIGKGVVSGAKDLNKFLGSKKVPLELPGSPNTVDNVQKAGFLNPFALVDRVTPRLPAFPTTFPLGIEDDVINWSPLNLIPGYGKKLAEPGFTYPINSGNTGITAYRKFGNSLDDVINSKTFKPDGDFFRAGADRFKGEGNWAEAGIANENYKGVFAAGMNPRVEGTNIQLQNWHARNGVVGMTKQGNPAIPITDPGLQFHRRLPFSNKYVLIDKQKLIDNKFQLATQLPHVQSLIEKYGIAAAYALVLGYMQNGKEGAVENLKTVNKYTIDPIKNWSNKAWDELENSLNQKQYGGNTKTKLSDKEEKTFQKFYHTLPDNLMQDDPEYDIRGYWDSEGRPEAFNYDQPKQDDGYYHAYSINQNTGEYLKAPTHPTFQYAIDEDRKMGYRPLTNVYGRNIATENPSIADPEEQSFLRNTEGPANYIETDLNEDEIEEYRRGGYIVEEINNFQNGGYVVEELPEMQSGGSPSEVWYQYTGTPWSEARKKGLTDGSKEKNIELRKRLLAGEFGKPKFSNEKYQNINSNYDKNVKKMVAQGKTLDQLVQQKVGTRAGLKSRFPELFKTKSKLDNFMPKNYNSSNYNSSSSKNKNTKSRWGNVTVESNDGKPSYRKDDYIDMVQSKDSKIKAEGLAMQAEHKKHETEKLKKQLEYLKDSGFDPKALLANAKNQRDKIIEKPKVYKNLELQGLEAIPGINAVRRGSPTGSNDFLNWKKSGAFSWDDNKGLLEQEWFPFSKQISKSIKQQDAEYIKNMKIAAKEKEEADFQYREAMIKENPEISIEEVDQFIQDQKDEEWLKRQPSVENNYNDGPIQMVYPGK